MFITYIVALPLLIHY